MSIGTEFSFEKILDTGGNAMKNPCKECKYYHKENDTCQSKKCGTGGNGRVTWLDRFFCKPCKDKT